jgi:hypothetical protein
MPPPPARDLYLTRTRNEWEGLSKGILSRQYYPAQGLMPGLGIIGWREGEGLEDKFAEARDDGVKHIP